MDIEIKKNLENDIEINDEEKGEFYKEKGNEHFKKFMYDDALDYYFKSISYNRKDHRCYGNIGQILINKEEYIEAKKFLEKAIELNSNYTKAFYRLGLVEKHLKNYDAALKNFGQVLKLEPNNKATIRECEEINKSIRQKKIDTQKKEESTNKFHSQGQNLNKSNISPLNTSTSNNYESCLSISNESNPSINHHLITNQCNKSLATNIKFPKIEIQFKLPTSLPKSSYQFNLIWKEIKDEKQKIEYLTFIGVNHFQKIFQKNLEPDFFSELISLFTLINKSLVLDFLNAIAKIDNFDFSLMFLSNSEKNTLREIIKSLNANYLSLLYKV